MQPFRPDKASFVAIIGGLWRILVPGTGLAGPCWCAAKAGLIAAAAAPRGRLRLRALCRGLGPQARGCAPPPPAGIRVAWARAGDTVEPMDDKEIMAHIDDLIKTEHELRAKLAAGEITTDDEHRQLAAAETALDQCWDLLRQRRARKEFGEDPAGAQVRPVSEVEGYRQ